jgi:hypothetical protein
LAAAAAAAAAAPLPLRHSSYSLSTITGLRMVDAQVTFHRSGKDTWDALWNGDSQGGSDLKRVMALFDGYVTKNERAYLQRMDRASTTYLHELTSMWEIAALRFMYDLKECERLAKCFTPDGNPKRGKAIVGGVTERLWDLTTKGGNDPRLTPEALQQVGCGDMAFLNGASTRVVTGKKVKKPPATAVAKAVAKAVKAAGQKGTTGKAHKKPAPNQNMAQRVIGHLTKFLVPKGSSSSS